MTRQARLLLVLVLNLILVVGLIIVGVISHSLGVLAAGVDYIADAAAIGVSLFAIWLTGRPRTERRPESYRNATSIAALINTGWLLILCLAVAIEALRRLASGAPHVEGVPVVVASGIATAVMTIGALVLGADSDEGEIGERMNMRAVLLDTVGDAAAAAGVAIAGMIILATGGNYWLDPLVALIIAVVVGFHAASLSWQVASEMRTPSRPGPEQDLLKLREACRRLADPVEWDFAIITQPGTYSADLGRVRISEELGEMGAAKPWSAMVRPP